MSGDKPMTFDWSDWWPKRGDLVRCIDDSDYFAKGEIYRVARARKRGFVGFHVYEPLGFAVLTSIKSFVPVEVAGERR